ncbi:MAG: rRNA pseudouridine synthase [Gemmatimonadota bacterium]|nr:MAG: rRNA pseudouridine synthase [Gemmatimonadota bacterium]
MPSYRLQRVLARSGVASRRAAEDLIRSGRVEVNGQTATVGMSVDPATDVIKVDRRRVKPVKAVWIALHKPVGYVVTRKDKQGRPTVFQLVPTIPGLTYVGRLDIITSGLLLMTTDGAGANVLTHPRYRVERKYRVRVRGRPASQIQEMLAQPIAIDDRVVQIVNHRVRQLGSDRSEISLSLTEGRYRIVRRLCSQLDVTVEQLTRMSHGPIQLGRLRPGEWRYLTDRELNAVRAVRAA